MIKSFASAALALSLVLAPAAAFAQDKGSKPEGNPDATHFDPKAIAADAAPATIPVTVDFDQTHDLDNILYLDLSNGQRVAIRLMPQWAPQTVERIKTLARQGFYDGIIFHRVIDGFMAQTGDPTGTGQGGSPLPDLKAEFNALPHVRGTVSMARASSEDSANSQFFIVFYPHFGLDRNYTNFGRVIGNMAAVDAIHRGEPPTDPTYIAQASIASDHKPPKFTGPEKLPVVAADTAAPKPADGALLSQSEGQ
jgi:cyclophilin family peptidyl-prolyl cis-trans isomerase